MKPDTPPRAIVEVGTRNPEGGYPPSGGEVFHDVRDGSGRISPPIGQNREESGGGYPPSGLRVPTVVIAVKRVGRLIFRSK